MNVSELIPWIGTATAIATAAGIFLRLKSSTVMVTTEALLDMQNQNASLYKQLIEAQDNAMKAQEECKKKMDALETRIRELERKNGD